MNVVSFLVDVMVLAAQQAMHVDMYRLKLTQLNPFQQSQKGMTGLPWRGVAQSTLWALMADGVFVNVNK